MLYLQEEECHRRYTGFPALPAVHESGVAVDLRLRCIDCSVMSKWCLYAVGLLAGMEDNMSLVDFGLRLVYQMATPKNISPRMSVKKGVANSPGRECSKPILGLSNVVLVRISLR